MDGPEFSIDCLCDTTGRCLNAIPRTMIESRGGESIKGTVIADRELVELGRRVVEALGVRGPCTVQVFRDSRDGPRHHRRQHALRRGLPGADVRGAARADVPRADRADGAGRAIEPHVGEFRAGITFTRYFWQLELDEQLAPTGRDIVVPPGPPAPR